MTSTHLHRAFELAQEPPSTHPNPRVGAVIVDPGGKVVGEGFHSGPGSAHAEVMALQAAGPKSIGSTMYVSLEPCNHQGLTPPCTEALIEAGVERVVVGSLDPDSRVSGGGVRRLEEAGLWVVVEEPGRARSVDRAYFHHRETGMPLVTAKWAMTLDGAVAALDGTSQWITGHQARAVSHKMRAQYDAVVVGAGTLRDDDPLLTHRITPLSDRPQPTPVIVAGRSRLPDDRRIWSRAPVVIAPEEISIPRGEVVVVGGELGLPDPVEACRALADMGKLSIMIEGGPSLTAAWWAAGVVAHGVAWLGAKIAGGGGRAPMGGEWSTLGEARVVSIVDVRRFGDDVAVMFEVESNDVYRNR